MPTGEDSPVVEDAIVRFAELALKSSLLANGGACIALLSFLGALASKSGVGLLVRASLVAFALGVLLSVMATGATYLAQCDFYRENQQSRGKRWQRVAIGMTASAYLLFFGGILLVVFGLPR